MSDSTQRPAAEDRFPAPPLMPVHPTEGEMSGPEAKREAQRSDHAPDAALNGSGDDATEALKRRLEETRLPADVKAQLLAELPPLAECEQLYREMQEQGGLSFEQFVAGLGLEGKPKP